MKVLLVKTSSLGDVVHTLPAVTEAYEKVKDLELTWVVEEGFAEIPSSHPKVSKVLPLAIRRWRKNVVTSLPEIRDFLARLRSERYDLILDSQGLIKSAVVARLAHGNRHGFDRSSIKEGLASRLYDDHHVVSTDCHAIDRQKRLLASALGYESDNSTDYGFDDGFIGKKSGIMLLHGTTWPSKEWPVECWARLAGMIADAGHEVLVTAGSDVERSRAERILAAAKGRLLDRLPLNELMSEIRRCAGVVSVDTGLGHLAPALGVPAVGLFGPTSPALTGIKGGSAEIIVSDHLPCMPCRKRECAFNHQAESSMIYPPCFAETTPERVWQTLQEMISRNAQVPIE